MDKEEVLEKVADWLDLYSNSYAFNTRKSANLTEFDIIAYRASWQYVCPNCDTASFYVRVRKKPKYKCRKCNSTFDKPKDRGKNV